MSSSRQISFGLELEYILAFHENRLLKYLREALPDASICKEIPAQDAYKLSQKVYPLRKYRSWAIANDGFHDETVQPGAVSNSTTKIRAYKAEPLEIAKRIIQSKQPEIGIQVHSSNAKPERYNTWILATDPSLAGIPHNELYPKLKKEMFLDIFESHWDSAGIEIISPPFAASDMKYALKLTKRMIDTLQDDLMNNKDADHTLFTTDLTALHVHVGYTDGTQFELGTVMRLTWFLTCYEPAIASLHRGKTRTPTSTQNSNDNVGTETRSLRDSWVLDEPDVFYPATDILARSARDGKVECYYKPLSAIYEEIFGAPDMDLSNFAVNNKSAQSELLRTLISTVNHTRGYVVNFRNLITPSRPNTVEFRQHHGTLNIYDDVKHWTRFCAGLVELASKRDPHDETTWREWTWEDLEGFKGSLEALLRYMLRYKAIEPESAKWLLDRQEQLEKDFGKVESGVFGELAEDYEIEEVDLTEYEEECMTELWQRANVMDLSGNLSAELYKEYNQGSMESS